MRHEPHRSRLLPALDYPFWFAGPILRIQPLFDIGMETRTRPIPDTGNPAVFHRVPVDICSVPFKVFFIPDEMFPIPPLPDAPLPSGHPAFRSSFNRRQGSGETCFYQSPSRRLKMDACFSPFEKIASRLRCYRSAYECPGAPRS